MKGLTALLAALALAAATVGVGKTGGQAASVVTFRDVTQQSGIRFVHNNGAFGKKFLPETLGPGVAFIDYDNDGWPDIFLVNGMDWPGHAQKHTTPKLYHNNRDGTFTDVTHKAGLDVEIYGMGVAVGDYDNDGFDDLFVTALGQSRLFHNNGNGTFTDVTQKAALSGPRELSTSAAWVDYDKDGRLDLVVGNYVQWTQETDLYCTLDGKSKSYCTPESYKGTPARLWHNRGDGTFEDVTQKAGLGEPTSKTMGIAVLDYDNDGWPDLLFSNDTQPNKLYRNNGNGTFSEKGVIAGAAFTAPRVGRGAAYADTTNVGRLDLLLSTNGGPVYLFRNEAQGSNPANRSVRLKLVGTKSNRDGIGAIVRLSSNGDTQTQMLRSGSSYLSSSELILTFGLGQRDKADAIEIRWPSGQVDRLSNVAAGQTITATEGKGQTSSRPYAK